MSVISNTVSTFIESQLPEFIRDDNPAFTQFIKSYYEWMEQSNTSAVIAQSKQLLSYKDIDQTLDGFLQYYINDFLPYFPNDVVLDERKLIKAAREFYQKKGSVESIQFLFRVLYGKEAQIFFPKDNILKASDGRWTQPQALKILLSPAHESFDVSLLVGRQGLGAVSNASCVIEAADKVVDASLGFEIVQLYISNLNQSFSELENLNVIYGYDANNNALVFSEKIIASISNIKIDSKNRGLKYRGLTRNGLGVITYAGDPVVISGGLSPGDPQARKAEAYVGNVTSGSITGVTATFGGYDYRVQPNTVVTVVPDPTDVTGAGANVIIQAIDATNSTFVLLNTDSIKLKANAVLSSANFAFANMALANIGSKLGQAFSYENVQFAAITSMNVINGGGGYTATPTLNLAVTYYSDYSRSLAITNDVPNLANNLVYIGDLGYIANVQVINGGSGYSNVTDKIVVPSSLGYNATFDFITTANVITSVIVTNKGEGYINLPLNLILANSANTSNAANGANAQLIAYGFGQGAVLNVQVNQIGQISDFRIVSRGFDYISTPNVSLRVQDFKIIDSGSNLSFVTDEIIFQGASSNTATYRANIDSYNVSTKTLRTYNYQGSLNVSANLKTVSSSQNVSLNTLANSYVTTYGNGKAKANAIFQNGLIQENGFYLTTDGFLSSDKYLQDSNTYHNFSYMIVVEKALMDYKNTLMQLVHPAGTSMLGRFSVESYEDPTMNVYSDHDIIPVVAGSVSANAFIANGALVGVGTNFGTVGVANDFISFNIGDSSRYLQTKRIVSVVNTTYLLMESNTTFRLPALATVNALTPHNLIPYSQQFDNVAWLQTALSVTQNVAIAPDGTTTATKLVENSANTQHILYTLPGLNFPNTYTISVYAKAGERSGFRMSLESGGDSTFTLSGNGTANALGTNGVTITPLTGGWYRCTSSVTVSGGFGIYFSIMNNGLLSYLGDGVSGIYFWGMQVNYGTLPTPYVPTLAITSTPSAVSINNSKIIVTTAPVLGNVAANDVVQINVGGLLVSSQVASISGNTMTVNTMFTSNTSNLGVLVYPSINTASYSILRTNP